MCKASLAQSLGTVIWFFLGFLVIRIVWVDSFD
jgi:hypothetical protein